MVEGVDMGFGGGRMNRCMRAVGRKMNAVVPARFVVALVMFLKELG